MLSLYIPVFVAYSLFTVKNVSLILFYLIQFIAIKEHAAGKLKLLNL